MSSTLTAWLGGAIKLLGPDTILASNTFYFGCSVEHLTGVPHEATWSNTKLPKVYGPEGLVDVQRSTVSIDQVDEDLRSKVRSFLVVVEAADAIGRVHWQVGNYHELLKKLARDADEASLKFDRVWAFGHWTDLQTVGEEATC